MSRTIQKGPYIDLSLLQKGVSYVFHLRNGAKLQTQIDTDWQGFIYPYQLVHSGEIYTSLGLSKWDGETPLDIIKVKMVKDLQL